MGIKIISNKKIETYEKEIQKLKAQLTQERLNAEATLNDERKKWKQNNELLKQKADELLQRKEKEHIKTIEGLNAEHFHELNQIKEHITNSINQINTQHRKDFDSLKLKHEKELIEVKEKADISKDLIKKQCEEKNKEIFEQAELAIKQAKDSLLLKQNNLKANSEKDLLIKLILSFEDRMSSINDFIEKLDFDAIQNSIFNVSSTLDKHINHLDENLKQEIQKIHTEMEINIEGIKSFTQLSDIKNIVEKISDTLGDKNNSETLSNTTNQLCISVNEIEKMLSEIQDSANEISSSLKETQEAIGDPYSYDSLRYELDETKRTAESAKNLAEDIKDSVEDIKDSVEDIKDEAESARRAAEDAKRAAEDADRSSQDTKSTCEQLQWKIECN